MLLREVARIKVQKIEKSCHVSVVWGMRKVTSHRCPKTCTENNRVIAAAENINSYVMSYTYIHISFDRTLLMLLHLFNANYPYLFFWGLLITLMESASHWKLVACLLITGSMNNKISVHIMMICKIIKQNKVWTIQLKNQQSFSHAMDCEVVLFEINSWTPWFLI